MPVDAFDEPEPVRAAADRGTAVAPEDAAFGVDDGHDVRGLLGEADQASAQGGQDGGETALATAGFQLLRDEHGGRGATIRVEAEFAHAPPGRGDDRARVTRERATGEGGFVHFGERARVPPRVRADRQRRLQLHLAHPSGPFRPVCPGDPAFGRSL